MEQKHGLRMYLELEECIEERLKNLSLRLNLLPNVAEYEYIHNINRLIKMHPETAKTHYTRLMRDAYEETVRYYERTTPK